MGDNVNLCTDGNFNAVIDGTAVEVVHGNKKTRTSGHTLEFTNGNKTFKIQGRMEEFFLAFKFEQVVGAETKQNFGALIETTLGAKVNLTAGGSVELEKSKKYHLGTSGHGWITSEETVVAREEEELAVEYLRKVSSEYRKLTDALENINVLSLKADTLKHQAHQIALRISTFSWKADEMTEARGSFDQTLSGTLSVRADTVSVTATGALNADGGKVKLDGGGGTVEVDGGIKVNGMGLTT